MSRFRSAAARMRDQRTRNDFKIRDLTTGPASCDVGDPEQAPAVKVPVLQRHSARHGKTCSGFAPQDRATTTVPKNCGKKMVTAPKAPVLRTKIHVTEVGRVCHHSPLADQWGSMGGDFTL